MYHRIALLSSVPSLKYNIPSSRTRCGGEKGRSKKNERSYRDDFGRFGDGLEREGLPNLLPFISEALQAALL